MAAAFTLKSIFEAVDKISGPVKTMRGNVFKFSKETKDVFKKAGDATKRLGAVAAVGAVAVGKAMGDYIERGDAIDRQAKILGMSATGFQELTYAANMADISQEDFATSVKKMNNAVGQLRMKEGALYTTLAKTNSKLAFQLRDAKSSDEAFQILAAAIAKETNVQKRAVLVQSAFGKSGQALIPMFDDLAKSRADARASGSILSDDEVRAAAAMDENLKKLKATGLGIANNVLGKLAEKLGPILDRFRVWADINKEIIGQKIDKVFSAIGKTIDFLVAPGVLKGIATLAVSIKALGVATMIFGAGNPMVLAIAGIAALITLIVTNWDKITAFFDRAAGGAATGTGTAARISNQPGARGFDGMGMAEPSPVSPNLGTISATSSSTISRSMVDINIPNLPAGGSVRQRGSAPGVSLNVGQQMASVGSK